MPKLVLGSHIGLLFVLSALLFPCVAVHLGAGSGAEYPNLERLAVIAVALALVMVVTEVCSGLRWPPLVALVAAVVGLVAVSCDIDAPAVILWSWAVAWGAVVFWFAALAAQARSNR